ncbi:MAG: cyclic nucleotide-binding domain-containing protein, partial [Bdellovibrionales bacterium]|nr:cyclic nucleotide-binding domain-containing protein [Bdellovibrionales bacterium]
MSLGLSAFSWGIASAVSLPLGAAIGLWWKPKRKVNSAFMAFGAGALLFALTIELFGEVPHHVHEHGMGSLVSAIVGAICGGLLFDALNSILNSKGGFLRKLSLARRYVGIKKALRKKKIIGELAKIDVLSQLPPQKMALLVQKIERRDFRKDTVIFKQGEESLDMFFLASGEVSVNVHQADGRVEEIASLGAGNTFGEIGVLGDFPRTADVVAKTNVVTYKISKDDVHDVFGKLPELKERLSKLSNERVDALDKESHQINRKWQEEAYDQLDKSTSGVTIDEIHQESHGSNAALAIWLGILIDGIPESLVIGMLAAIATGMSVA